LCVYNTVKRVAKCWTRYSLTARRESCCYWSNGSWRTDFRSESIPTFSKHEAFGRERSQCCSDVPKPLADVAVVSREQERRSAVPGRGYPEAVLDLEQPIAALEARAASSNDLKRKMVECANQRRYWPLFS
jgi:hypothetical protein